MNKEAIKDLFDNNMNMTLDELAMRTGKTVAELVDILMSDKITWEMK